MVDANGRYALLSHLTEDDRRGKALILYNRWCDAKSDTRVNLPDDIMSKLKSDIVEKGSSDIHLFDAANKDVQHPHPRPPRPSAFQSFT